MSLDIAEQQVLIDYFDDPNFHWHGRILLVSLPTPGMWVVTTPDYSVQVCDLRLHRVVPLQRNAPFPDRVDGGVYYFDPFEPGELEQLAVEARAVAAMMGGAVVPAAPGAAGASLWVIADPRRSDFGDAVPDVVLQAPGGLAVHGEVGVARFDDEDGDPVWVHVERAATDDKGRREWRDAFRRGLGRDPLLLARARDGRGRRRYEIGPAISSMRESAEDDWPWHGPRAVSEVLDGIASSQLALPAYGEQLIKDIGLHGEASLAHEIRSLISVLLHLVSYDQVCILNSSTAEFIARRLLQIQKACRHNPKTPNFTGLEQMLDSELHSQHAINAVQFGKYYAQQQQAEAFTLKQQRLHREETEAAAKRAVAGDPKGKGKDKRDGAPGGAALA